MSLFQQFRKATSGTKSVIGRGQIWSAPKFSLRQYSLVAVGLLILAGGIVLLAASPNTDYHVDGNTIRDPSGATFTPHGVARPSLEWDCQGEAVDGGAGIPASDFSLIHTSWGANTVRIPVDQDFWLAGSGRYCPSYQAAVKAAVIAARNAGLVVILDLHRSDAGNLVSTGATVKQCMPDQNSTTFWQQAATAYKGDSGVWFELYNEPHPDNWTIWKDGGNVSVANCAPVASAASSTAPAFRAVGMQLLYNAVRATGANNIVLASGDGFASHLDGVPLLSGANIAYAIHPYATSKSPNSWSASDWDKRFGYLTLTVPVVATAFGNPQQTVQTCQPSTYDQGILDYFRTHGVGYTGWAWFDGGCSYPSLITNAQGACFANDGGCVIQQDMLKFASGKLHMTIPGQPTPASTTSTSSSVAPVSATAFSSLPHSSIH